MKNNPKIVFFGSSRFSVLCLDELKTLNLKPDLIITTPDMPIGRGLKLTATPVKLWAEQNNIECLSPDKLDSVFALKLSTFNFQLFLVASYGKIIPKNFLNLPKYGTINIHPSLLPKYRGPSPLQEQILNDEKNIGVSIMLMDEKIDHGPIISQREVKIIDWPVKFEDLEKILAKEGAKLLMETLNPLLDGKLKPTEQNHSEATFTKKIKKENGLLDIENGNQYKNFLKIQAFTVWPKTYFFVKKGPNKIRVIIKDAEFNNGILTIKKVLPEGKKEIPYQDFLRGLK